MATTLHALKTYYDNVMRSDFSHIPATHLTLLTTLSTQVDGGTLTLAAAQAQVVRLAVDTTSVASLAYNFFTGSTPFHHGFDYLVSAGGPNPNNLNSAYYQAFNVENRYINFAMNLGKGGEGAAWFSANYGALTMGQAVAKAYGEIFGVSPTDAKIDELLNSQVPDGRGGTYTRNAYFATYGGDGLDGIGTKAAMVGWLLAAAAKEDIGTYAKANDAFLADLATDGVAFFRGELTTIYGPPPAATPADDTITVTGDLAAGQTLAAGPGHDKVTVTGTVYGRVTADGGDTLVLGRLGLTPGSLGVPEQISSVAVTGGGNTVWLKGGSVPGATVTATGASNTLHIDGGTTFHEGAISGFQTVYLHSGGMPSVQGATVIYDLVNDPTAGMVSIGANNRELVVLKDASNGVILSANGTTDQSARVDVHLQNFMGAPTTKESVGRGYYQPDGGAIVFYARSDGPLDNNATLALHVDTDSTAGMIVGFSTNSAISPNYRGPVPNLVIDGAGKLTAQIASNFTNIDARQAGDLNLAYRINVTGTEQVVRLGDGTNSLRLYFDWAANASGSPASAKVYLGAGVDTISLGAGGYDTAGAASGPGAGLSNLYLFNAVTLSAPPQIVGFQKGVDHLVLDTQIHAITADVQTYADGKATLQDALIAVSAHVAANTGAVFTWGGDTYVYAQDTRAGVNSAVDGNLGDGLIKLTGVTGLTVGTGAGSYDIHYG
ncbi:bluetail domain-containing putative surface protein [Caulobacter sp.]|uniref:bluetail domain-containing putative surface protein n=1 Tax=Caulobacter sp. TaxID=78 RepID=UPI001B29DD4E|nr:bluetail domain-containing putative surface protein [Caulobacter sp.]MBO9543344.1 hypothetical protein [Caulobacter sp.]